MKKDQNQKGPEDITQGPSPECNHNNRIKRSRGWFQSSPINEGGGHEGAGAALTKVADCGNQKPGTNGGGISLLLPNRFSSSKPNVYWVNLDIGWVLGR
jgi:hypothetical protein